MSMMVIMRESATSDEVAHVRARVEEVGASTHVSVGEEVTVIAVIGDREDITELPLEAMPGVDRVVAILRPYKLVSREFQQRDSVIDVRAVFQQGHREVEVDRLPPLLLPRKGRFGLIDYEKAFAPDLQAGADIFASCAASTASAARWSWCAPTSTSPTSCRWMRTVSLPATSPGSCSTRPESAVKHSAASARAPEMAPLVVANARRSPGYGCALRLDRRHVGHPLGRAGILHRL